MIFLILLLVLILTVFLFSFGEILKKKGSLKNLPEEAGCFLLKKVKKLIPAPKVDYQDLLCQDSEYANKRLGKLIGYGLILCCIGLAITVLNLQKDPECVNSLERPAFGDRDSYSLKVQGYEEEGNVSISLEGKDPDETEMADIFDQAYEEVKEKILSENESFENVCYGLEFIYETENGIEVTYESDNQEYLTNYGLMLTEIPEEGIKVGLTVTLSYGEYEKSYLLPVRLMPVPGEESFFNRLEEYIETLAENTKDQQKLLLPENFEGVSISYAEDTTSPYLILVLFLIIAVLLLFLPEQEDKQEMKKRRLQLEQEYSNVVCKLAMLTEAGLSVRKSFERIEKDYEEKEIKEKAGRKKGSVEKNYLLEELKRMRNQLNSGLSETESYLSFGRRSGLQNYIKLGNILSQSVRQGVSGLDDALNSERKEALAERKTIALRKGEQATTKQLFPMLLMLLVVIIVLLVPTLSSF